MVPLQLQDLADSLEKAGFQTRIQKKDAQLPLDTLLVPVGMDDEERPFILQIQNSDRDFSINFEEDKVNKPLTLLTFLLGLPYEITDETKNDVMRMLLIANKALPLQGLGYSEPERAAYFLYTYPSDQGKISANTLYGIVAAAGFVVDNIAPVIRDIIAKKTTVEKILAE